MSMMPPTSSKPRAVHPALVLGIGILAVSTASTFIRLAQGTIDSLAVAAWRLALASLLLAPFALKSCRSEWRRLDARSWRLLAASGVMLAIHFYAWITSLEMTSVAASAVLVGTNPLFVGLVSHFILRERLQRRMLIGILIAVAGSAIISLGDWSAGAHQLQGDLLAVVGAVTVAIYMLIGRRLRGQLSLLGYVFPVYGIAAFTLMVPAFIVGVPLTGYPTRAWLLLVLLAIFPQLVGHSSFNWALGHLPATFVSMAALAEPIGATTLAWIILQESPSWITVLGGLLILLGLSTAAKREP
ncbi:MAG: DMT family transporter [Anaerolineae bacterium]|nr:DMT family transporter [Anaerolineae bacterium]